jgi:glutaminase
MMSQEFTYMGLPGKSGIGGGIVALYPKVFCRATWSLDLTERKFRVWNARS